jgi:hypothetical protein
MESPLTIAVQPAGTAAVGFLSAVKEATRTSPAVVPDGLVKVTAVVAVVALAVVELTAVTVPEGGGGAGGVEPMLMVEAMLGTPSASTAKSM